MWGATCVRTTVGHCSRYFNPRTPCGVRPAKFVKENLLSKISIHAPRVGCDVQPGDGFWLIAEFQSTHPVWGATSAWVRVVTSIRFQSTHPVWGATCGTSTPCARTLNFNPRTPCGVRLGDIWLGRLLMYFNPRTPCGVRHPGYSYTRGRKKFQSTHPVWGATFGCASCASGQRDFNPRTPCGVRRDCGQVGQRHRPQISIHAPRVGCDATKGDEIQAILQFQSTHPVWGATCATRQTSPCDGTISIHAPRVGCDWAANPRQRRCAEKISIHAPRVGCDSNHIKTR